MIDSGHEILISVSTCHCQTGIGYRTFSNKYSKHRPLCSISTYSMVPYFSHPLDNCRYSLPCISSLELSTRLAFKSVASMLQCVSQYHIPLYLSVKQPFCSVGTYNIRQIPPPVLDRSHRRQCLNKFPMFGIPASELPVKNRGYDHILHNDIAGMK